MDDEEFEIPEPPWLRLLEPVWRAWRENEILKGRNPDPYIEGKLKEACRWPPHPGMGHA
jgi:hypothetical protein